MEHNKKKPGVKIPLNDVRCGCGNLFFYVSEGQLQIKCKRCRNITTISLKQLLNGCI